MCLHVVPHSVLFRIYRKTYTVQRFVSYVNVFIKMNNICIQLDIPGNFELIKKYIILNFNIK